MSPNRSLSLAMKTTNFQGSLPSPPSSHSSLCNINAKNNNRNIEPDHLNIKTECNDPMQTNSTYNISSSPVVDQCQRPIFPLKTEPDEYVTLAKHHISSIIDNNHNQFNGKGQCQSSCQSNSFTDHHHRPFISSDESESANTVLSTYNNNSSDAENFKESASKQPVNISKEDVCRSPTSPLNDKTFLTNVSSTLPEEKSGLSGANKYEDNFAKMMKGQSAGNRISVFQLNLNAMAPESISESYNYIETYRLEELADACAQLHHWCNYRSILYEMRNLKEIYRVAEHVFQHFISMAKMVTAFTNLCETDQLSLLKYSVTEILILRSVSCFLPNEDAWIFNLDNNEKGTLLQFNTCKTQLSDSEFSDDIRHFILAVPENCRNDRNLFDLATMVVLFNPNCSELKHKDVVRLEHITYCHLLCKYIHINYSSSSSSPSASSMVEHDTTKAIQFNTMLNLIDRLHKINQKFNNVFPFRFITEEYNKKRLAQI
ncbi:hypothetical protein HUG17_4180 [Dermatophagoides farinae]|uniref:NR LBD domain-containing protein n=1 Tax=Dermatophagoides farinae TaxID=6954 RepID=A0A9D4SGU9_DERFA|nr:uncharacterized protein LOC124491944 [Dermatophagoides farinae]KAH7641136.1 hypothetical protein HUG17_4180 [Dermatophagoides farinae]